MGFLAPDVEFQRMIQEQTMTEEVEVWDVTTLVGVYPCRVTSFRLFSEPADPYDANVRSFSEWGFTLPVGTPIQVGNTLRMLDRQDPLGNPIEAIVGEVVDGDTWQTALRVWANRPKTATPFFDIEIVRFNPDGTHQTLPPQTVQIVYDRVTPQETPVRYQNLGRASYQGGTIVGGIDLDVEVGDRFELEDAVWYPGKTFVCFVREVLPFQPQRREAKFVMDVGSPR